MLPGLTLPAIPWVRLSKVWQYQLASYGPDTRNTDFGDSHASRGWGYPTPLLSMLVPTIIDASSDVTLPACQVQRYFENTWFLTANPFTLWPALVGVNWTQTVAA